MRLRRLGVGSFILSVGLTVPAGAATLEVAPRSTTPGVTIVDAPTSAIEGDRIELTVKIALAKKSKRVQLQEQQDDIYGNPQWVTVRSVRSQGSALHNFRAVADGLNSERFRARATYDGAKPVVSRPLAVTVWRWISLNDFDSYYSTYGVGNHEYLQFAMNGAQYRGWYTSGPYRSWESRHTPGRNCRAFRADLGVTDDSLDGSSGTITLLTEDGTAIYTSPPLTPGMVTPVEVELDLPYRFWVQANDTSPEDAFAWPAMGDAAFLCTSL